MKNLFCIVFIILGSCAVLDASNKNKASDLVGHWKIINGFMVYNFDEDNNYRVLGTDASGTYSFSSTKGAIESEEESIEVFLKGGFLFIANDDKESVEYYMLEPIKASEASKFVKYMRPLNEEVESAFERMRAKRLKEMGIQED